jgi:hypothetical protein
MNDKSLNTMFNNLFADDDELKTNTRPAEEIWTAGKEGIRSEVGGGVRYG